MDDPFSSPMLVSEHSFSNDNMNASRCSICLEDVTDNNGRSIAKLHCGHLFHLDCIGSEFNVRGLMRCPNCREVEDGNWLFSEGEGPYEQYDEEESEEEDELESCQQPLMNIIVNAPTTVAIIRNGINSINMSDGNGPTTASNGGPMQILQQLQPMQNHATDVNGTDEHEQAVPPPSTNGPTPQPNEQAITDYLELSLAIDSTLEKINHLLSQGQESIKLDNPIEETRLASDEQDDDDDDNNNICCPDMFQFM
ncbi:hypothetical protein RND71_040403 [Anisodus tanguticus]|uniref:RING-type domain-containing protein n=1 Tax=Anisodus tanguticus TaxID=243964 RepID=A0AAE1QTB4_9SOLA|nr:hypothetical protein RND71_040403 [Anisodus tanguticus]